MVQGFEGLTKERDGRAKQNGKKNERKIVENTNENDGAAHTTTEKRKRSEGFFIFHINKRERERERFGRGWIR